QEVRASPAQRCQTTPLLLFHHVHVVAGAALPPHNAPVLSRIGSTPIPVPPNVTLDHTDVALTVTGPLGTASVPLHSFIKLDLETPQSITVSIEDEAFRNQRAMWGTTRTHIANALTGISTGFSTPLYSLEDPRGTIAMKLGYSHTVYVPIPPWVDAKVETPTKIVLSATDKHLLGLFSARVRAYRKPEPYKGKGIFIGTETVRVKSVKKK
ncbi:ribosomal protein L6, partial [Mucidula mucida]